MPSNKDLAKAQKIADWNTNHGSIIGEVNEALGRLEEAIPDDTTSVTRAQVAEINAAGSTLAAVTGRALEGPFSGVPGYDTPRVQGLEYYERAGRLAEQQNPFDESDDSGFDAGILLAKGTELTAVARAYANELLTRVQQ